MNVTSSVARRIRCLGVAMLVLVSCRPATLDLDGRAYPLFDLYSPEGSPDRYHATANGFMIATDAPEASQAGAAMSAAGGNIVDAAVAVSFAISVVRPQSTGLGGGGFLLLHLADEGRTLSFDFRERAPLAATRDLYQDRNGNVDARSSLFGSRAVAVPGTVAGLVELHERFGSLPLEVVLEPARKLAAEGFIMYADLAGAIAQAESDMDAGMRAVFLPDGRPPEVGERFLQPDLAVTIERIGRTGRDGFYEGPVAQALVDYMAATGGLITRADLDQYEVRSGPALLGDYNGYRIATMPPPSSGVFILNMLSMLARTNPRETYARDKAEYYHMLIEVFRRGYQDRARYGGDPLFVDVPVSHLLSDEYISGRLAAIDHRHATPSESLEGVGAVAVESRETTHFSILDRNGNAIASTQSVNYRLGARVMIPGTGVVLNDTMDDFSAAPGVPNVYGLVGGQANAIAGGKTPLSSMSPTIVFERENPQQVRMVLGAPGGSRIITSIIETILNDIEMDMHAYASVARARLHHQYLPDRVFFERGAMGPGVRALLEERGHRLELVPAIGAKVFLVRRDGDRLIGASDPRGDGQPLGGALP